MIVEPPRFRKYHVVAELDRGGMADVFLCMAKGPGGFSKLHVLKCVRDALVAEPKLVEMFLDEAKLAAQLNHPNIVQTFEVGMEAGRYFIAMEYLEGQTLTRLLRAHQKKHGGPLPRAMHLRILCDAMQGLHYAHGLSDFRGEPLRIVHRDVSPQNLFVTYAGAVKVLDFGIAKASLSSTTTDAGVFKGKISYVAPEQASGEGTLDHRADVFSMGILLWHAAVGRSLWQTESDAERMTRILSGTLKMPRDVDPDVPVELDAIVRRALKVDPAERHGSMAELRRAVEGYLETHEPRPQEDERTTLITELFATERASMSTLLRERMEKIGIAGSSSSSPIRLTSYSSPSLTSNVGNLVVSTREVAGVAKPRPTSSSAAMAIAAGIGVALALVIGLVGIAMMKSHRPAKENSAAASAPATNVEPPPAPPIVALPTPAEPKRFQFSVQITPSSARVTVDGVPYSETHSLAGGRHRVTADAPGYSPLEKEVELDRSQTIVMALQPLPTNTQTRPTPPAQPAPSGRPVRKIEKEDPYK